MFENCFEKYWFCIVFYSVFEHPQKPVLAYEREARENTRIREAIAWYLCHHVCEHVFTWVASWTYKSVILKNIDFILFFTMFFEPLRGILGASWSILGATWEHFGNTLGVCVGLCWGMLAYLKTSWAYKSYILKNIDFILFLTMFLSPNIGQDGSRWIQVGPCWAKLGRFWSYVGLCWRILGPS